MPANPQSAHPPPARTAPWVHVLAIAAICIVAWLALQPCLANQLGVWDDTPYVIGNGLVKDLSPIGIKRMFTLPSMGNYHPLTILSFALEYSAAALDPVRYHTDALLLHLLATTLVYWLAVLLSHRPVAAVVAALLFAVHPMHVESIAWVAARKDLLYTVFFLAACISYLAWRRSTGAWRWLLCLLVILLFVCSLLSKAMAVTLPLVLLLIDYLQHRPDTKTMWIEKAPLLLLSVIFGIIAIRVQQGAGAMEMETTHYNVLERLALGAFALTTYLWKAVVPAHLHCMYNYPVSAAGSLPGMYYLYLLMLPAMAITWLKARSRVIRFGLLFFLANIALVLQFIPVGSAIVAERYTYLPYLGLCYIAGWFVSECFEPQWIKWRYPVSAAALVFVGVFACISNQRCSAWFDESSLWRDEINKEPDRAANAMNNLGYQYITRWAASPDPAERKLLYDSASLLMNKAISIRPGYVNPYLALGELQRSVGDYEAARRTYMRGLEHNRGKVNLYFGLAILHYVQHNMDSAGCYFRAELSVNKSAQAYGNYANYLEETGKSDSALIFYNQAVARTSEDWVPWMNRGNLLKKLNRWQQALDDYNMAIRINPDAGQVFYLRSFCDTQAHDIPRAVSDIQKAISLGFTRIDTSYYNQLLQR